MKHTKRIFAILLSVAMVMTMMIAMSATAFAADPEYSITVTNTNDNISIAGKTYTAYKLFDATYGSNKKAAYTIKKTDYFYTNTAAKAILDKYFDFKASSGDSSIMLVTVKSTMQDATTKTLSDANTRVLADKLKSVLSGATAAGSVTIASGAETGVIALTEPGFYIVDGKADPKEDNSTGEIVAAVALTNAKPTATVNPKADAPSVDKKIKKIANGTDKVEADGKTGNGSVGDKVEYELTSKVPNMTGYTSYQFIYTDTMSKGLTFNDDIAITIDGTAYTAFTKEATTNATTGVTTIKITFNNFINQASKAGKDISIKYSATINEKALEATHEDNTVSLSYSNNPYDTNAGTPDEVLGKTPDSKTEVYDTNIELTKVDTDGNKLTGAKFKIEGNSSKVNVINSEIFKEDATNGTYYRLKDGTYTETAPTDATSDQYDGDKKYVKVTEINKDKVTDTYVAEGWVKSDSTLSFNGLGEGTYTITELVAPEGYNLLESPITVTVTFDPDDKVFTAKVGSENATVTNNVIKFNVQNNAGTELPSTGGIGTVIFYVLGSALLIGCGVVLISKRRMTKEK